MSQLNLHSGNNESNLVHVCNNVVQHILSPSDLSPQVINRRDQFRVSFIINPDKRRRQFGRPGLGSVSRIKTCSARTPCEVVKFRIEPRCSHGCFCSQVLFKKVTAAGRCELPKQKDQPTLQRSNVRHPSLAARLHGQNSPWCKSESRKLSSLPVEFI